MRRVAPRELGAPPTWELGVRYGAAYACVLVAVAAAQLIIPTGFAFILAGVALMGLPVSLSIRQNGFGTAKNRYSHAAYARLVTIVTSVVVLVFLRLALPDLFGRSAYQTFVRTDTLNSIKVLMQIFLLFAVCRCFAIISDKDAVLSTVPSFSVLLLLMVAYREPEVVLYFLLWAILTAVLFALDHRAETRAASDAAVPAFSPGQDIALSARALFGVVTFSLVCAFAISNWVASHQDNSRGRAENWIISLSSRLTSSAFDFADASVNGGPERTIDFNSSFALPTRTPLWAFSAHTVGGQERYITPQYLRMFTLVRYDGRTWTQSTGSGRLIDPQPFERRDWSLLNVGGLPRFKRRPQTEEQLQRRSLSNLGFTLLRATPSAVNDYGAPRQLVRQRVRAITTASGYIPLLPVARALKMRSARQNGVRVRDDGAVEIGVMNRWDTGEILSEVPPGTEYGGTGQPPLKRGDRPNPGAVLSAEERAQYLEVSKTVPRRVHNWAQNIVRAAGDRGNDYRRAQLLSAAVRARGDYTLRPPVTPETSDAVDYFLFQSRRGYCTFFASALTVACRTQGIPARVVSGFVNPEYFRDSNDNDRVVGIAIEANAHAWTEVWVDGWGWAVLDATPPGDRGDNAPGLWDGVGDAVATWGIAARTWIVAHRPLLFALLLGGALLVLVARRGALVWLLSLRRDRKLRLAAKGAARENDLARARVLEAYRQGEKLLAARYRRRAPWETPAEWTEGARESLFLADASPFQTLVDLYMRAIYSRKPLQNEDGDAALAALQRISWEKAPPV